MRYGTRPRWQRWQRWLASHRRGHLVALSIAWFTVGLGSFLAALATYGWRTPPIEHTWHLVAWLAFISWVMFGQRLHRRR